MSAIAVNIRDNVSTLPCVSQGYRLKLNIEQTLGYGPYPFRVPNMSRNSSGKVLLWETMAKTKPGVENMADLWGSSLVQRYLTI